MSDTAHNMLMPWPARSPISRTLALITLVAALALCAAACTSSGGSGSGAGSTGATPDKRAQSDESGDPAERATGLTTGTEDTKPLRLVVVMVIDQLASWTFERDVATLDGGIARLIREGVYYPRIEVPYAITFTAPGHASIGTGAPPSDTRILANSWYQPNAGRKLSAVFDADSPIFTVGQRSAPTTPTVGASSKRLAVDGVADVLRRDTAGKGKSVSVSLKQRAAILAAGRRPDIAIWYDATQVAFTTSSFYVDEPPNWLRALAVERPVRARFKDYVWTLLTDIDHAAITGIADTNAGEFNEHGLGNTFPFPYDRATVPERALRATPLGDEVVLDAVYAALAGEHLGQDEVVDLLTISWSAHDNAAHAWGQESWERLDLLHRLDHKLGQLLSHLDKRVGKGRYAVVLTSDHGATPLVEHSRKAGKTARRIANAEILAAANQAAVRILGDGVWAIESAASSVYMSARFGERTTAEQAQVLDAAVDAIRAIPGISYATRTDRVAGDCERRTGMDALACRSVVAGMSGPLFFTAAENHVITRYKTGTGHGSPNLSDRHVPLIISAPGWQPRRVTDEPISLLQIAPTVAALLGIGAPPAARAPALRP